MRKDYIKILFIIIVTRICLLAIVYTRGLPIAARWDEHSYIFIAKNWYVNYGDEAGFIVFPPLYPILIKFAAGIIGNFKFAALVISNLFYVLGSFALYKLARLDWDKKISERIVTLYILFPTSYFLSAGYPELLFVFLLLASFYFARKNMFFFAGIYGGFATLTRPYGLAIWPALFIEWLLSKKRDYKNLIFLIFFGAVASAIYLLINYQTFGDYFAFTKMLSKYWQKDFEFFGNGIWQSWKIGFYRTENDYYKYLVGYAEAISATLGWMIVGAMALKPKLSRYSYIVYSGIAMFMATSTHFILSMPRYYLSIPFMFIFLGKVINNKYLFYLLNCVFVVCNIYLFMRFGRGQWAF